MSPCPSVTLTRFWGVEIPISRRVHCHDRGGRPQLRPSVQDSVYVCHPRLGETKHGCPHKAVYSGVRDRYDMKVDTGPTWYTVLLRRLPQKAVDPHSGATTLRCRYYWGVVTTDRRPQRLTERHPLRTLWRTVPRVDVVVWGWGGGHGVVGVWKDPSVPDHGMGGRVETTPRSVGYLSRMSVLSPPQLWTN